MRKKQLNFLLSLCMTVSSMITMQTDGMRSYASGTHYEQQNILNQGGIHYKLKKDDSYVVVGLDDDIEKAVIPPEVEGKPVTKIKSGHSYSVKEIQIPDTVVTIEECAFSGCRFLDKIVLPKGLETIKKRTFSSCCRLRTVILPDALKSIKEEAFCNCSLLESVKIPNQVENISMSAFKYCHLIKNIVVEDGNANFRVLEDGSLLDCNKNDVIIHVDRTDLENKERLADYVYSVFKNLMPSDNSLESLKKNIDDFMQQQGGGKPDVLSEEEFDQEVLRNNKTVLYRGIRGKQYCDMLRYGEKAYFPSAFNGCGIYTTDDKSYASSYVDKDKPCIMRMYLKDDANVASELDIDMIRNIIVLKHYNEFPESKTLTFGDLPNNVNKEIITNYGLIARILGFDALINLDDNDGDEFGWIGRETVVLNRSKLVVCDKDI